MKKIVLATDLGGTNLRMAAIAEDGEILYRTKHRTPRTEIADEIVSAISEAAQECLKVVENKGDVKALAAAVPGIVNADEGIIYKAPNLAALDGLRISNALTEKLNLPCFLENDANAAAVGENWLGASRGFANSICVTLGTGVGGGIIIDGKVLRGVDGTAAEIGHICVEPFGVPCGCGSRGCLEQYASATAIVRLTRELSSQYPKSVLRDKMNLTSLEIYEAGKEGDELALEVFRKQGFYLGIALAGLINVLNPEVIVIGGGAAAGWDLFISQTKIQIEERAYREPAERAKLVQAECGDDAGILGVARLAFKMFQK
jgi:glucokinase